MIPHFYKAMHADWEFIDCAPVNYWNLRKSYDERQFEELRKDILRLTLERFKELVYKQFLTVEDILTDFQILTPMRKTELGIVELNKICQQIYINPDTIGPNEKLIKGLSCFCVGDKIVHTSNKDMPIFNLDSDEDEESVKVRIFNGTLGIIRAIDHENASVIAEMNTGETICYDFVEMGDIVELAYVLTVHKAQGSEFKEVLLIISSSHYKMLNNQWLYTAVTRAKMKLTIIGEDAAFRRACKNINDKIRYTWLGLHYSQQS